ncbi:MAG: glycosyltransferase family 39 protein [Anaerolineae bacterium]
MLVAGLTLFHAINNWIWLDKNVMTRGWDRIGSLVNSLYYHQTLSEPSLPALFNATIQDAFRPPLFGLSMAGMYKLFGVSADVAVMVNVLYLFVLLAASYGLGAKLGGRRLGMLSATLVALIPLVFAMSRYSYFEFSLTALTILSLYCLLASDGFERKGFSILLGVALGLGLLIKRTFPVFVIGAVGVVFFQAGMPRRLWNWVRSVLRLRLRRAPRWRDIGIALGGGLLLSGLWFLPSREAALALPSGSWLFPLWWLLFSVTIYLLLQPASPEINLLTSFALALSIASVWYLPHGLEFVKQILWLAWGIEDPRGRTVDLSSLSTYTDYLRSIFYGFSPFYSLLLILTVAALLLYALVRRQRLLAIPWWRWKWWPVLVTLVASYLILSTSIYKEDRAITPILPLLGIILAAGLLKLPWKRLNKALIAAAILVGMVQFFAISYTGPHQLLIETTYLKEPILGQWSVFAQGLYLETPDSGLNDPDYWIAQDVLDQVEAGRQREGWAEVSLGIIAYSSHVHVGMFAYDQLRLYPHIQLEDPTQTYPQDSAYSTAFRYDYVLVLKNKNRRPAVRDAENLILNERRALFDQAFEEVAHYPLPDGSEAYLFRRRYRPENAYGPSSLYQLADRLQQATTDQDRIFVHPPGLVSGLLEYYTGPAPVSPLDSDSDLEQSRRIWVIVDPNVAHGTQDIIAQLGSPATEEQFDPLELLMFGPATP